MTNTKELIRKLDEIKDEEIDERIATLIMQMPSAEEQIELMFYVVRRLPKIVETVAFIKFAMAHGMNIDY